MTADNNVASKWAVPWNRLSAPWRSFPLSERQQRRGVADGTANTYIVTGKIEYVTGVVSRGYIREKQPWSRRERQALSVGSTP